MKDKKEMPELQSKAPKIYQRVIFVHMTTHDMPFDKKNGLTG